MRECVCLQVGQAGCQLGSAVWELFALEQGISPSGLASGKSIDAFYTSTFFSQVRDRWIPRSLMIDTEIDVHSQIRTGEYGDLYNPDFFVNAKEDAANNFARGSIGLYRNIAPLIEENLRKLSENTDSLQSFILFNSLCGGTGSGVTPEVLNYIRDEFRNKTRISLSIFPSRYHSTSLVEPYNGVFCINYLNKYSQCAFLVDNSSLFSICSDKLEIKSPNYSELNHIVAQAVSTITCSLRAPGTLNIDLIDFPTNLVPFEKVNLPVISYAPLTSHSINKHQNSSVVELTRACINPSNSLFDRQQEDPLYISCCLLYRGDVNHSDINFIIKNIKDNKKLEFCPFIKTGFKVGINSSRPVIHPQLNLARTEMAACMVSNSTVVVDPLTMMAVKFKMMFNKKAFVHWYLSEGFEEAHFDEALTDFMDLIQNYSKIIE